MQNLTIDSVLDQAEKLSFSDQVLLTEILRKRLIEEKRRRLVQTVQEGQEEYKSSKSGKGSVDDLFNEIENIP